MRHLLARRLARKARPAAVLQVWRQDPQQGFVQTKEWKLPADRYVMDIPALKLEEGDFLRLRWDEP
jgi:hypothetical protein